MMSDTLSITPAGANKVFQQLVLPEKDSHKGQNGKLMIIGGSELFHAASRWSLETAARLVDMVFYSSVPGNNQLIQEAKGQFWNGIVVARENMNDYLAEADVVLIGPGMTREAETAELTNSLVKAWPSKKWVIDAGALQMIDPALIPSTAILTPHGKEWQSLLERAQLSDADATNDQALKTLAGQLHGACILLKGRQDILFSPDQVIRIEGGNAGLTKGGTGDALAGLVAGLYVSSEAMAAATMASITNKQASLDLAESVGPFFDTTDLVNQIPKTLWQLTKEFHASTG